MLDVFLWILVIAGGVGGIVVTHLTYLLVRGGERKEKRSVESTVLLLG